MRGIFAAGVLDAFHDANFHPFDIAIGTSAGACNLASHLAGQHGRNRRCYLTQMLRPEFIDARRFLRGGHWLDIDYLWDAFDREDPLDVVAATSHARTRLIVAATCVDNGRAQYFEPTAENLNETLRASSAVPIMYRRFVELDGMRYTDGGVSAPIPIEEAYRRGARDIVVIRSRPADFPGPSRLESTLARVMLREHRGLVKAFIAYRGIYARAARFARTPPRGCRVIQIAPEALKTTRTTRDPSVLEADYAQGREAGERAMREWG